MRNYKNVIFYVTTIGAFSLLMYIILQRGERLEPILERGTLVAADKSYWMQFIEAMRNNLTHPLAILLAQIVAIIFTARIFGYLCIKISQPVVVGEILAGIVLGPSVIGYYFPEFSTTLFPSQSLNNLQFISQIGLILFMFVVGMELDLNILRSKAHEAVVISHASIIIPFALGVWLAYFIYAVLAPPGIPFVSFALFIGISMSITAFPVLARIVQEKGMQKTKLGNIVITCAAADDITAWCILAAVIAIAKAGSFVSSLYTIILAFSYVLIMLKVVRPFLKRVGDLHATKGTLDKPIVAIFFITLLISSYATETIGIHALFGAFMAGVVMPQNVNFRNIFIEKIDDVAQVLLLPLFFVFTGLRTQIGLLNDPMLWQIFLFIIVVAVSGKFFGSAIAAKFVGQSFKESFVIGALMNTRGLMELIVLNIGFDLGILTPQVFTMLVLMALLTTFMTGPALAFAEFIWPEKIGKPSKSDLDSNRKFSILFSFGNPKSGESMMKIAGALVKKDPANASITALHMFLGNEMRFFNVADYEMASFKLVKKQAQLHNIQLTTLFKAAIDINREIVHAANIGNFDLLIVGVGHSIYEGTLLGNILGFTTRIINPEKLFDTIIGREKLFFSAKFDDKTTAIIRSTKIPVGVFIDKEFIKLRQILVPFYSEDDLNLFPYIKRFIKHNEARIAAFFGMTLNGKNKEIKASVASLEQASPAFVEQISQSRLEKDFVQQFDLVLISLKSWEKLVDMKSAWLTYTPSVLIIKP